jgi:glycerol uptake facilitator-like aquaporin
MGTALLVCAVVGSGIMAERLAGGNAAVALLANTIATGAALLALILMFALVSGAHLNPVVSLAAAMNGDRKWFEMGLFSVVQIAGAIGGTILAHLMFGLPLLMTGTKVRSGTGEFVGEFVATFGLIGLIIAVSRRHDVMAVAFAVAAYISAAYWFTSSTSFANPAVTIARAMTDTFAGIRPSDVPAFIAAQILGGVAAAYVFGWLVPKKL